jgi:hypothetical protein
LDPAIEMAPPIININVAAMQKKELAVLDMDFLVLHKGVVR